MGLLLWLLNSAAAPVAVDDRYPQSSSGPTVVPGGSGILKNDSVPCATPTKVEVISGPSAGVINSIGIDGSFSYSPVGMPMNDQFRYRVTCPGGLSSEATVYLPAPPGERVNSALR